MKYIVLVLIAVCLNACGGYSPHQTAVYRCFNDAASKLSNNDRYEEPFYSHTMYECEKEVLTLEKK